MARNDPELRVRIPEDVRQRLLSKASENGLSLSAQVVALLSQGLEYEQYDLAGMAADIEKLQRQVSDLMEHVGIYDPDPPK